MVVKLYKFGEMLISRPSGREAYLYAKAYLFTGKVGEIEFDFDGVKVLTPSWIDEFVSLLKSEYQSIKVTFRKSDNPTVISSLKMIKPSASSF